MAEIPLEILTKLHCCECQNYLSCAPVFSKQNGDSFCGRCPQAKDEPTFRNTAYEMVVSMIAFPCRFKDNGCCKLLTITEVKEHEDNCEYQKICCQSQENCQWKGIYNCLLQHYKDCHKDLTVDQPYNFNYYNLFSMSSISENQEKKLMTVVYGFVFLIQIKCDMENNILQYSVELLGPTKIANQFTYTINISKQKIFLSKEETVQHITKQLTNKPMTFNITALDQILQTFQDVLFKVSITRQKFVCVKCAEEIIETLTNTTKERAIYCDNCNNNELKSCENNVYGCCIKTSDNNIQKHKQWFCKFEINSCHFCNNAFKNNTRVYHLTNNCSQIIVLYSSKSTYELQLKDQQIILKINAYEKEFFCVFVTKKKSLIIAVISEESKEEMQGMYSVEVSITSEKNGEKKIHAKNQRLAMPDEGNCDWKDTFSVAEKVLDIKIVIKKWK